MSDLPNKAATHQTARSRREVNSGDGQIDLARRFADLKLQLGPPHEMVLMKQIDFLCNNLLHLETFCFILEWESVP
jgi:hypothetical protein